MSAPLIPVNITFKEWASQLISALPHMNMPIPGEIEAWRDWALSVSLNNADMNIPRADKLSYPETEDWRRWAAYFIAAVFVN